MRRSSPESSQEPDRLDGLARQHHQVPVAERDKRVAIELGSRPLAHRRRALGHDQLELAYLLGGALLPGGPLGKVMSLVHEFGVEHLEARPLGERRPCRRVERAVVAGVAESLERVHHHGGGAFERQRLVLEAETTARLEHSLDLGEERLCVGEVVRGDAARRDVERAGDEGEAGRVGHLVAGGDALPFEMRARLVQHLRGDVGHGDPRTRPRERQCNMPAAGRDVERSLAGTRRHLLDEQVEVGELVCRNRTLPHACPPTRIPHGHDTRFLSACYLRADGRRHVHPILVIMLDGLGDRPWPALGGLTPLQAADTPNLDAVARASATGLLHTLGPGRAPGTELAHFVLFGYPESIYPGRAVFEAAGHGIGLSPDQVVLHAIFAIVRPEADGSLTIVERYPGRPAETIAPLAARIGEFSHAGLTIRLTHTVGEQAIVTIDGGASTDITDTDPHNNGWPVGSVHPLDDAADPGAARRTAEALTAYLHFAYDALAPDGAAPDAERPFLLLKWTARKRPLASFSAHTGMRGVVISSAGIFEGITRELGMEHRRVAALPDLAEDARTRMEEAAAAFADGAEFVLAHFKQPDEAGHEKDPALKRDVIAGLDAGLVGLAARAGLPPDTIVVVTGDHGTPAGTELIHSGDPVPIAILADAVQPDDISVFDARACSRGRLGHLVGDDFMPMLLNARGTVRYTGGRLAPHTGLFWPRDYEPFKPEG